MFPLRRLWNPQCGVKSASWPHVVPTGIERNCMRISSGVDGLNLQSTIRQGVVCPGVDEDEVYRLVDFFATWSVTHHYLCPRLKPRSARGELGWKPTQRRISWLGERRNPDDETHSGIERRAWIVEISLLTCNHADRNLHLKQKASRKRKNLCVPVCAECAQAHARGGRRYALMGRV